ncbi:MAG: phosphoenolpyruvate--protein phosphotransferase [Verrucomicrobia bacterium]|nr:phosphoenolpyruvate--protein phosphotransferase [Verrucomicrobiota bacterium]
MAPTTSNESEYKGIAASPGVAHGPAYVFIKRDLEIPRRMVAPEQMEEEIARFERALLATRQQISQIRAEIEERLSEEEASIFDAHMLVLEDRALIEDTIREMIDSGLNIEHAFQEVSNRYIDAFANIDDEYIKERATDIRDVSRRVMNNLLGKRDSGLDRMDIPHVLVVDDLTPSDTATLDRTKVLGIVSNQGSRTSHSVIMARSINVPCVVGIKDFSSQVQLGDPVLVDGFDGTVLLQPSDQSLFRYGKIKIERQNIQKRFQAVKDLPAATTDGKTVRLMLNIDGLESEEVLTRSGAEGVGLFRTEGLFLSGKFPDEDEQFEVYKRIVQQMSPYPVTLRTLDLGGDKNPHSSLYGYQEANPFMGFRAIRFCLENTEVFKDQLRAILRASAYGKTKLMYPMISSCEEVVAANVLLEEAKNELMKRGEQFDPDIQSGCMIEIPSAAVITDLLADHCKFFSIGTNDLIQYMLAVDRVNDRISHLYEPNNPAIMRALNFIFESGRRKRVPVSVCGEMASDPVYAVLLFGMGASELSLNWSSIAEVKYLIRRITFADARQLAFSVLRASGPDEIAQLLRTFQKTHLGIEFPSMKNW